MSKPLVSIALPVYNVGRHLRLAVLSILCQTFADWELLIVDDGSTDGSVEGIADITDARVRILKNPRNLGLAATLNAAIDLARGVYFARMDGDDISYPDRIRRQVEMLERDPSVDLVSVRCLAVDENDEPVGLLPYALNHRELSSAPWRGFYLPHPTWMGRIEWFRKHRYTNSVPYPCEDQEMLLRTWSVSCFVTCPEVLFAYRIRSRLNWSRAYRTRVLILKIQIKHFLKKGQLHNCLFSLMVFCFRLAIDIINSLLQAMHIQGWRHYDVKVSTHERVRFAKLLSGLKTGT